MSTNPDPLSTSASWDTGLRTSDPLTIPIDPNQSSISIAVAPNRSVDNGRFLPGNNANPAGGHRDTLGPLVRRLTKEGQPIVGRLIQIAGIDGDPLPGYRGSDRLRAIEVLLERGWGKVPTLDTTQGGPVPTVEVILRRYEPTPQLPIYSTGAGAEET